MPQKLLLVSRDDLLRESKDPAFSGVFRALASLNRRGYQLLLTAPQPDGWRPTRRNVDQALVSQSQLLELLQEAGGELDGVYYVNRSLLTQDRNRQESLSDIMARYGLAADQVTLISSSAKFLRAASRLGIHTIGLGVEGSEVTDIQAAIKPLAEHR